MSEAIELVAVAESEIRKLYAQYVTAAGHTATARNALKTAQDEGFEGQEDMLEKAADMAHKAAWSGELIDAAIAKANSGRNDTEIATLRRFASELALAMSPTIRGHLPLVFRSAKAAWNTEEQKAADAKAKKEKAPERPCKMLWSRRYQMLVDLLRKRGKGFEFPDAASVVAYATANDPAHDPEKVARKIKSMEKNVKQFFDDFPDEYLGKIVKAFAFLDEKKLAAARVKKLAEMQGGGVEVPPPSNLRTATGEVKPTPEPTPAASEAPSGIDIAATLGEANAQA